MYADRLLDELREAVGTTGVLTGDDMAVHLVDFRRAFHGAAIAVARPATTEQVSAVLRACARAGAAVVTQGGNTGLSGAAIPDAEVPSVILSLARMNAVDDVDPAGYTITAQAGCSIEAIQDAAAAVDRLFGPDWGARGTATIGGAVATNAGGINVLRYGPMREHILGVEVVLADGTVWNGLRALRKDSSGYDLKQLFIGSEGTLGVVTRVVVKLLPATPHHQTCFAALADLDGLMPLLALGRTHAADGMTAFELIPEVGVARVTNAMPSVQRPLPDPSEWYVMVRFSGTEPVTDRLAGFLEAAAADGLITDAVVAATADQESNLWVLRDELPPPGKFEFQHVGVKMDTAVPIDRIGTYFDKMQAVAAEIVPDALTYAFGHAGDGNLHVHVFPRAEADVDAFVAAKPALVAAIDQATFAAGGTISAEHGIGQELTERVRGQKPAVEFDLMYRLKDALDPTGMLNPNKVLPRR